MLASLILPALLTTFMFIKGLCPLAMKIGLTDHPSHRKQHKTPTPLIGGLAIYLTLVTLLLTSDLRLPHLLAYIAAATLLIGVGVIDDFKGLGVKSRIVAQLLAGLIMTEIADIKISHLGDLLFFGDIELGPFTLLFTLFAIVGGINAFNMIDGIDGLAGGLSLVSLVTLCLVFWLGGDMPAYGFCLIIIVAVMTFLGFNLRIFGRSSAKIFLGDAGSTLLGFTICWLAIDASQRPHPLIESTTVLWIIAIPLFDSVCIMLRRLNRKKSPFDPDREHLHHVMLLTGYNVNQVVQRLVSYGMILAGMGLVADLLLNVPEAIMLLGFLLLFACHYWGMSYAWLILKTTRYLRTRRKIKEGVEFRRQRERRVENLPIESEQRSGKERRSFSERRFIPTPQQLEKFYRSEERMENANFRRKFWNRLTIFWLNLYIGSK